MANNNGPIETQPVVENPFNVWEYDNDWSSSICNCTEDIRFCACSTLLYPVALCCIMRDMKEGCCSFTCIPLTALQLRTKLRSVLRIKVSFGLLFWSVRLSILIDQVFCASKTGLFVVRYARCCRSTLLCPQSNA